MWRHAASRVVGLWAREPRAPHQTYGMARLLDGGCARFGNSVANDVEHQRMQAKRRAEVEADARPLRGEVGLKTFQVFSDMHTRGEEVRKQEDSRGSALYAGCRGLRNGWLGQFEIGDLDDGIREALSQEIGELAEVVVGCRESAAMSNQQDGGVGSESFGRSFHARRDHGDAVEEGREPIADGRDESGHCRTHERTQSLLLGTKWILPEQSLQATFMPTYLMATRSSSSQCGQSE